MKKSVRFYIKCILILVFAMVCLTGCKETDVLKTIIFRENQQIVKEDEQIVDNNAENEEEDDTLQARKEEEQADQKKDTEKTEAVKSDSDENNEEASGTTDVQYDNNSNQQLANDNTARASSDNTSSDNTKTSSTKKSKSSEKKKKNNDAGDLFDKEAETENDEKKDGSDSDTKKTNDGSGDDTGTEDDPAGDDTPKKQVTDANGDKIEVPENAEKVTAVGEVAPMIEMLGGSGRLLGTSESLTANQLARNVFDDLSTVQTWWSGDGSDGISDTEFQSLVAAKPDCCFIVSGTNTFSEEQLGTLAENDIAYFTLYPMNTPENIEENVTLIGKILGNRTADKGQNRKDAVAMAKKYNNWVDEKMDDFLDSYFTDYTLTKYLDGGDVWDDKGSGVYTLFVNHWDDYADVEVESDQNYGIIETWEQGAPAADGGFLDTPYNYYLSIAGVVNTAAAQSAIDGSAGQSITWYVNQWLQGQGVVHIYNGQYSDYLAGEALTGPYLTRIKSQGNLSDITANLGDSDFTTIIAGSDQIRTNLEDSKLTRLTSTTNATNMHTYSLSGGMVMESTIKDDYDIVINPYGVSSWYEGSAESFLESYWATEQFFGRQACEGTSVKEILSDFYQTFYGYELSEAELESIIDGDYVPDCRTK